VGTQKESEPWAGHLHAQGGQGRSGHGKKKSWVRGVWDWSRQNKKMKSEYLLA